MQVFYQDLRRHGNGDLNSPHPSFRRGPVMHRHLRVTPAPRIFVAWLMFDATADTPPS